MIKFKYIRDLSGVCFDVKRYKNNIKYYELLEKILKKRETELWQKMKAMDSKSMKYRKYNYIINPFCSSSFQKVGILEKKQMNEIYKKI